MIGINGLQSPLLQTNTQQQAPRITAAEAGEARPSAVPVTDRVTKIVPAVVSSQEQRASERHSGASPAATEKSPASSKNDADSSNSSSGKDINRHKLLSDTELKQVEQLRQRDQEVKRHEAAHLAAAGQHATGGARFTYSRGPDGRSYAIGGSVGIDVSPESNPEATIRKANQIKRAAMAPAEPSAQDRSVAAAAVSLRHQAQAEVIKLEAEAKKAEAEQTQSKDSSNSPESRDGDASRPENSAAGQANNSQSVAAQEHHERTQDNEEHEDVDPARHRARLNQAKIDEGYLSLLGDVGRPAAGDGLRLVV